jgi:hypothetical protein
MYCTFTASCGTIMMMMMMIIIIVTIVIIIIIIIIIIIAAATIENRAANKKPLRTLYRRLHFWVVCSGFSQGNCLPFLRSSIFSSVPEN